MTHSSSRWHQLADRVLDQHRLTREEGLAVLAAPDAPARLFLDQIDALGVRVERVITFWHALAEAWDPGAKGSAAQGPDIITAEQAQPIGPSHMDPIFGLHRGFGGKCLPKDSMALKVLADELGVKYEILEAIQTDNAALRDTLTGKPSDVETQDD